MVAKPKKQCTRICICGMALHLIPICKKKSKFVSSNQVFRVEHGLLLREMTFFGGNGCAPFSCGGGCVIITKSKHV